MKIIISFVLSLLIVSCTSLKDIHKDKIEFVKSILNAPDICEDIVINSEYYIAGVSKIYDTCNDIKEGCDEYGKDNLSIELDTSEDNAVLYINIFSSDKGTDIVFQFFNEGHYKGKLKYLHTQGPLIY